ncbi:MAG: thioredoxin family protein [Woeseiaceae bacterium]
MGSLSKYRAGLSFVGGFVVGLLTSLALLRLNDTMLVSRQDLDEQMQLIADLQDENHELMDELFAYKDPRVTPNMADLPYEDDDDAAATVALARQQARDEGQFLMVTFGANWCLDCLTLYRQLRSPEVQAFAADTFDFVNVNVGKFNTNVGLAAELGVELQRGIPVAVFFGPDGRVIGTTNEGQLEPSRYYTSRQILKFVRDIVEKSLIAAPDSVQ